MIEVLKVNPMCSNRKQQNQHMYYLTSTATDACKAIATKRKSKQLYKNLFIHIRVQLCVTNLHYYCAEFSIENNEILRVSLSIEKNHKDLRVGGAVYNRIILDGLISWVLWRWNNHRAVTLSKLSSKYSCEVNVFVSICITW